MLKFNHFVFVMAAVLPLSLLGAGCGQEETEAPTMEPAPSAEQTGEAVDSETKVRFETLLEQVMEHIRKRDFGGAETGLAELEKMSPQLPESMRQQISTARAALAAARAGSTQGPVAPASPAPTTR